MDIDIWIAGVISGALLYIKDDFESVNRSTFLQVCMMWNRVNVQVDSLRVP